MKIAIDTGPLKTGHRVRGIGVNTRELLLAMREVTKLQSYKDIKINTVDFSRANLSKYDILHYQFFNPFSLTVPNRKITKTIITIHDLIPLIYPEHYPPGIKGKIRFQIQKYLLRNIDAIIAISETSKKDICRFLEVSPEKVHVVYLAPRKIFRKVSNSSVLHSARQEYGLPPRFVLYVGDINYNKNIPTLVEACQLAKIPLVICGKQALDIEGKGIDIHSLKGPRDWARYLFGKPHPEIAHYQEVLDKIKRDDEVRRLGYVPDNDLVAIYNLASVYCQPSYYEGFGLPILEAQASGCPVVASRIQAHVEVADLPAGKAGNSALFADPKNSKDFANKIFQVESDKKLRNNLIKEGLRNSKKFSWQKTAKETINVYKKVLSLIDET